MLQLLCWQRVTDVETCFWRYYFLVALIDEVS
jgi:hypothetical protein